MTPPLHIVLYQPEIPPNTGNIARLCAKFDYTGEIAFPSTDWQSQPSSPLADNAIRRHRAGA